MEKIKIGSKEYEVRSTISSLMGFEKRTGKEMKDMKGITDTVSFVYETLRGANKKTFTYTFEEFTDMLDENPGILDEFNGLLAKRKPQKKMEVRP